MNTDKSIETIILQSNITLKKVLIMYNDFKIKSLLNYQNLQSSENELSKIKIILEIKKNLFEFVNISIKSRDELFKCIQICVDQLDEAKYFQYNGWMNFSKEDSLKFLLKEIESLFKEFLKYPYEEFNQDYVILLNSLKDENQLYITDKDLILISKLPFSNDTCTEFIKIYLKINSKNINKLNEEEEKEVIELTNLLILNAYLDDSPICLDFQLPDINSNIYYKFQQICLIEFYQEIQLITLNLNNNDKKTNNILNRFELEFHFLYNYFLRQENNYYKKPRTIIK